MEGRDVRNSFETVYFGDRDIIAGGAEFYDNETGRAAIDFLLSEETSKLGQPFYMQVHFINPHDICEYFARL